MSSHAHEHQPLGGRVLTLPFLICAALVAVAGVILFQRYTQGLAAVSNLNDGYPWGIWVAIDVVIGSAFGCAGYVIALLCYILNRGEYHPLVRPAVLASLFGYGLAGLAVLVDLGRYWNFYHMMLPWYAQPNSVMLEVGLCVATYTLVLVVEFAPAFLERFGIEGLRAKLNRVLWVFIALGVLLPTMHQSSLGTMMVIVGHKLSPLWQSQMLPVFFLLTAILMGFAIVVWESVMASLNFRRPMETPVLSKLAGLMLVVASLFVVLRFVDLIVRGQIGQIFGGPQSGWFVAEMALMISGLALLIPKANRNRSRALFLSASLLLAAGILYRLNVYLIGFTPAVGPWHYFPSVKEIMVTVGVFALEIALYLLFVKKLPVMHAVHPEHG
ncbi:[NiFe]-hydrogenase II apocytochrome b subunit [Azospirillum brasilense]|uniref:[NiFe]-hydrogenase II apocytochrome b subunit n=1 Tax=Azospirillum brasilense TaxID=192 RepID=A0A560BPZ8_AZOBR|nr:Ni/Fe-hydrogenase cytochrome b subunit [Azospirillum brasilense]TWA74678.1 [NiFe]-hydrogenase II apocytochrome b subunit [Azospirillum brasilense]